MVNNPDQGIASAASNSSLEADVIVVGAGPGGSSTAAHLARMGVDVILLEKAVFPRDKVCGDGLTPRGTKALTKLGIDTSEEAGWIHNTGLRVHGGPIPSFAMEWPELKDWPNYGLACPRMRLDEMLARHAQKLGATLFEDCAVTDPILSSDDRIIGVRSKDGREFRAPVVVAADGNSSRLAVKMGVQKRDDRPMGVAVRGYYTSPKTNSPEMESWVEMWDGKPHQSDLLPGYGWLFPLGDGTVNVGLGMLNTSKWFGQTDYKDLMHRWLANNTPPEWGLNDDNLVGEIRSAALPMAFNRQPHYGRGLLLVGDAGGMVNPFNGEGIPYAMEAGEMAALAIADARARGFGSRSAERALGSYASRLKSEWGGYYRLGIIFAHLIGDPRVMKICTKYGLPRKNLMKFVHKLLAHLTDETDGDAMDHIINTLIKLAPSA